MIDHLVSLPTIMTQEREREQNRTESSKYKYTRVVLISNHKVQSLRENGLTHSEFLDLSANPKMEQLTQNERRKFLPPLVKVFAIIVLLKLIYVATLSEAVSKFLFVPQPHLR